ncbi:MGA_1079 family surface serine endopeptidase [Mycoplasmopsis alligatoris]|nr:hypothetical protein [Mycoplasmopsis alligatoris]
MTIQENKDEFLRFRKLEFKVSNGKWLANKDSSKIEFLMPKNYYEPIFENKNSDLKNPKIILHLPIVYNNNISNVWSTFAANAYYTWPTIELDYQELKDKKELIIKSTMKGAWRNGGHTTKDFNVVVKLNEKGISFEVVPENKEFRFTQKYYEGFKDYYANKGIKDGQEVKDEDVPLDKAIYFDTHGTNTFLEYKNNIKNEVFSDNKTNIFDYDNVSFNQFDNPILIKTNYKDGKAFAYNFNQNVPQKWSNGYKTDYEVLSFESQTEAAKEIRSRTFAGGGGSYTILRKVNDDPNDYRYYGLTNQHVVATTFDMWNKPTLNAEKQKTTYLVRAFERQGTELYNSKGLFHGPENMGNIPYDVFWSAISPVDRDLTKTRQKIDAAITIFDIKETILRARRESRFETAEWLENWKNLKPLDFSYDYQYESFFYDNLGLDYTMGSFPWGKPTHYLINRTPYNDDKRISINNTNITRLFFGGGASGSGILNSRGEFVSPINSGNYNSLFSFVMKNRNYDMVGANNDGNPFLKDEAFSIIAHMYRANLFDPRTFNFNKQMEVK